MAKRQVKYVNPSIPKDKIFWAVNLKTLHFENRSFRQDQPPEISFEYQGARDAILRKSIAPEKFHSKYLNIAPNCAQRGNFSYMLKCFLPCEPFAHSGNGHFA